MTGMEHVIERAARTIHAGHCCPCDLGGCHEPDPADYNAARALAEAGLLTPSPLTVDIEEAYQRGHEDGYWNGKTTDMSPAQAAAFMAPYRSHCPGCADRAEVDKETP